MEYTCELPCAEILVTLPVPGATVSAGRAGGSDGGAARMTRFGYAVDVPRSSLYATVTRSSGQARLGARPACSVLASKRTQRFGRGLTAKKISPVASKNTVSPSQPSFHSGFG